MFLESRGHSLRHLEVLIYAVRRALRLLVDDSSAREVVDTIHKTALRHFVVRSQKLSELCHFQLTPLLRGKVVHFLKLPRVSAQAEASR